MNYNYTDNPFYANTVEDSEGKISLIIEKIVMDEELMQRVLEATYKYDVTGLTVTEVDELTRQKIQELNG